MANGWPFVCTSPHGNRWAKGQWSTKNTMKAQLSETFFSLNSDRIDFTPFYFQRKHSNAIIPAPLSWYVKICDHTYVIGYPLLSFACRCSRSVCRGNSSSWDIGGQESLRASWSSYYCNTEVGCWDFVLNSDNDCILMTALDTKLKVSCLHNCTWVDFR